MCPSSESCRLVNAAGENALGLDTCGKWQDVKRELPHRCPIPGRNLHHGTVERDSLSTLRRWRASRLRLQSTDTADRLCSGEPCSTPHTANTCHITELARFVNRGMDLSFTTCASAEATFVYSVLQTRPRRERKVRRGHRVGEGRDGRDVRFETGCSSSLQERRYC